MNLTSDTYVAEWSYSQQQYHINTVGEMLKDNNEQHRKNKGPDYIPLGFFATSEEASKFIGTIEAERQPKQAK
jgi:hypothetical protein